MEAGEEKCEAGSLAGKAGRVITEMIGADNACQSFCEVEGTEAGTTGTTGALGATQQAVEWHLPQLPQHAFT